MARQKRYYVVVPFGNRLEMALRFRDSLGGPEPHYNDATVMEGGEKLWKGKTEAENREERRRCTETDGHGMTPNRFEAALERRPVWWHKYLGIR